MSIKPFFLLVFIALCGTFIYLKVQINGNEKSQFNQTTRYELGEYPWARKVLGLHNDGDARAWYLSGNEKMVIEVARASNVDVNEKAFETFVANVEKYTGREVVYFQEETFKPGRLSDADLEEIVRQHRRHEVSSAPNLFIIYAEDFNRDGIEVAKTFKEFAMVLSDKRLKEITQRFSEAFPEYVQSTMLHEFGHQLGLDHNTEIDCLMNEKVEKPNEDGIFSRHYTQTDFCDYEKNELEKIKQQFNK
jgi:predicted Zn-dependent protease